jgi:hypothetical protein
VSGPAALAALAAAVVRALDDSEAELKDMPFFVRPMVRRGLAQRTGRSFDQWRSALLALTTKAAAPAPELAGELAQLADHFRTAPERAKRGPAGSSDEAMRVIAARAAAREAAVRALIDALAAAQ